MDHRIRLVPLQGVIALTLLCLLVGIFSPAFLWPLLVLLPLLVLGLRDLTQTRHSLRCNFPRLGHFRYLIEAFGAPMRQYIVEQNKEGRPFDRDFRSLVYQHAKNLEAKKPFGTELDVYSPTYVWMSHSMVRKPVASATGPWPRRRASSRWFSDWSTVRLTEKSPPPVRERAFCFRRNISQPRGSRKAAKAQSKTRNHALVD